MDTINRRWTPSLHLLSSTFFLISSSFFFRFLSFILYLTYLFLSMHGPTRTNNSLIFPSPYLYLPPCLCPMSVFTEVEEEDLVDVASDNRRDKADAKPPAAVIVHTGLFFLPTSPRLYYLTAFCLILHYLSYFFLSCLQFFFLSFFRSFLLSICLSLSLSFFRSLSFTTLSEASAAKRSLAPIETIVEAEGQGEYEPRSLDTSTNTRYVDTHEFPRHAFIMS